MKSYVTYILVSLLLLSIVFNIYQATSMPEAPSLENPPVISDYPYATYWESLEPHEEVFIKRLEVGKIDRGLAESGYCHFEDSVTAEHAAVSKDLVLDYNIHSWQQLSDQLWSVSYTIYSISTPDGVFVESYVGFYHDRYCVFVSSKSIPEELRHNITSP